MTPVNFAVAAPATYSISGTVTSGGLAMSGVTMTLSGASTGTTTTDAAGAYAFTGLANGSYTVTPTKVGSTFVPASTNVTVAGANVTPVNFVASVAATYNISGTVTSGGLAMSGVTMTLSGASTGTVTTDAAGAYAFTGLANGAYTITPSKAGSTFVPASTNVTVAGANVTPVNFAASVAATYNISGTVTSGGTALAGVTMSLSGAAVATTTTDAVGNYVFTGLANGAYLVTPSMAGYSFTPIKTAVTIAAADATLINFDGTLPLPGGTLDPTTIPKYVTPLVIPPVMKTTGVANTYDIAVRQFKQQILPGGIWNTINGRTDAFLPTTVWSYGPRRTQCRQAGLRLQPTRSSTIHHTRLSRHPIRQ